MELITKSQLTEVRASYERTRTYTAFNEASALKNSRKATSTEVSVFLSHKHD